jgi:hypothetical protein
MAKLSMQLIKQEMNNWSKLKKSIDNTPKGKIGGFGKIMNLKYNLEDKGLEDEIDPNMALLRLMSKHVQDKTKV